MPLNKTDLFMHTMTDITPVTKGIIGYGIRNHSYHKRQAIKYRRWKVWLSFEPHKLNQVGSIPTPATNPS